jgi:RNA polymerase sigma factor (sigma-70 family)
MAKQAVSALARAVRKVKAEHLGLTDRDLLQRFTAEGSQAAFAALVSRHSAMVLGVCKRVLPTEQDAEDACQAVFLVLAGKASSGRWQASVANWLYTTARKVAHNARVASSRRARREGAAAVPEAVVPADPMTSQELIAALDEELDRLPPRYREPLVLCYLEGLTRDEAAARLGVPEATLKSQLERGRKKLADALTSRGCTLGVALLVTAATSAAGASPPRLVELILAAAGGSPSAPAATLAREVAMNGIIRQAKWALLAVAGTALLGFGLASVPPAAEQRKPEPRPAPAKPDPRGRLAIRVLDPDGRPVPNARVIRRSQRRSNDGGAETTLGKTDSSGRLDTMSRPFSSYVAVAEGHAAGFSGYDFRGRTLELKLAKPLPIKGRLVDLQGKPIANARVVVVSVSRAGNDDLTGAYNAFRVNPHWSGASFSGSLDGMASGAPAGTTTGKDGRFELKSVGVNHVVRLRFFAEGIESSGVTVFADPAFAQRMRPATDAERAGWFTKEHNPAVYGPDFTHAARPEHLIVGTVVDGGTGKPVPGVEVWGTTVPVTSSSFLFTPWLDHAATKTDEKGRFKLTGLAKAVVHKQPFLPREAKRYLHVRADGAPYLDQIVTVSDAADYTPVKVEVQLRPALVVTGVLVNKATHRPVRGQVRWAPLASNRAMAEGKDAAASLYVAGLSATRPTGVSQETGDDGRFRLRVPPGPCVLLASADGDDLAAVFTAVQVRDEDRRHLRKPSVAAEGVRSSGGPRERAGEQAFHTLGVTWPLRWMNGYAILEPDAKAKSVEAMIEFDPGARVKLVVTDPDGKPLSGVTLVGHGRYGWPPPTFASATIDVGGLSPKNPPEQLYLLHEDRKLCAGVLVKGSEKGHVAVKMRPCGTVTGRVVDRDGKPVAGMVVDFQMTEARANDLLAQKLFRDARTATTDAAGRFLFERMFPGVEFDLIVVRPGFRSGEASKRTILKPGETKDVGDFELRASRKRDD